MTTPIGQSDPIDSSDSNSNVHGPSQDDIQSWLDDHGLKNLNAEQIYNQLQNIFSEIDEKDPSFWDDHGLEIENGKARLVEHQGDGNDKIEMLKQKLEESDNLNKLKQKLQESGGLNDDQKKEIKSKLEEIIKAHRQ